MAKSFSLINFFFFLINLVWFIPFSSALEPDEVLVLANRNAGSSVGLARYYMTRRGIPEENVIPLWITDREWCSREDYETKVASPVRKYIREKDPARRIRCIVTMYGMPLKVLAPRMTPEEIRESSLLEKKRDDFKNEIAKIVNRRDASYIGLEKEIDQVNQRIQSVRKTDQGASLDSEIALVLEDGYSLSGWVSNPFFVGYPEYRVQERRDDVFVVSRLDGPSDQIVRRVIDDSVMTEQRGLAGRAYFDARWPRPENKKNEKIGYGFYDRSIHLSAELVKKNGSMPVILNDKPALFQPGDCPDAALYCGWYSLARYVDAFEWRQGSVGYHIASAEAQTLKQKASQVWCKMMLEKGVAATLGPVSEPYVQAFPIPELFFRFLIDGFWSLAECYALSQPFWSWQMVLIGDPLYRPFKNRMTEAEDR